MRIYHVALLGVLTCIGCAENSNPTTSSTGTTSTSTTHTTNKPVSSDQAHSTTATTDHTTNAGTNHANADATNRTSTAGTVTDTSAPNNTAVNKRDRDTNAKTPIDQNENERDIKITADIRKRVVGDKDLSTNAHNAKIITADGKVTLRGPVNSQDEKDRLESIARDVAGKDNVDNQLEIVNK